MTESEWLVSTDPSAMLQHLTHELVTHPASSKHFRRREAPLVSPRQFRFWCAALVQMSTYAYPDTYPDWRDGKACKGDNDNAPAKQAELWAHPEHDNPGDPPMAVRAAILRDIVGNPWRPVVLPKESHERSVSVSAPASITATPTIVRWHTCPWLTPQVLSLARAAYSERPGRECKRCPKFQLVNLDKGESGVDAVIAWGRARKQCVCRGSGRVEDGTLDPVRLAILGDCLEESGCDNAEILGHLRSAGPHVRGCFAVDCCLGLS